MPAQSASQNIFAKRTTGFILYLLHVGRCMGMKYVRCKSESAFRPNIAGIVFQNGVMINRYLKYSQSFFRGFSHPFKSVMIRKTGRLLYKKTVVISAVFGTIISLSLFAFAQIKSKPSENDRFSSMPG